METGTDFALGVISGFWLVDSFYMFLKLLLSDFRDTFRKFYLQRLISFHYSFSHSSFFIKPMLYVEGRN